MSAFVVREETIQAVLSIWFRRAEPPVDQVGENGQPVDPRDELGRNLWSMNADAVAHRYREQPEKLPAFQFRHQTCSKIQALKSAYCLRYQCLEGDVPERPLFKQLEDVIHRTAFEVIETLPEFDRANWG